MELELAARHLHGGARDDPRRRDDDYDDLWETGKNLNAECPEPERIIRGSFGRGNYRTDEIVN